MSILFHCTECARFACKSQLYCEKIIPLRNSFSFFIKLRKKCKKMGKKGFSPLQFAKIGGMIIALKK